MVATSTSRLQDDEHPRTREGAATTEHVMDLLEEHVPLSLLMDLVEPSGPDSHDILATEGAPDEAWWAQP
jgi:hypothetical protein